jgi:flavin-dependent dehydrogenase
MGFPSFNNFEKVNSKTYDIAIVGGGLAGLACGIEAAKNKRKVVLFEKNRYPFHKVCGEYISNESWNYLKSLGLPLEEMNLPQINQLKISTAEGTELNHPLKKGGFGISRYTLDFELSKIAKELGVKVLEETEVSAISFKNNRHIIESAEFKCDSKLLVGSFGKRSKLDKSLDREFIKKPLSKAKNYVGIKYHVEASLAENLIGLHIFKDGYCGISKVEGEGRFCFCYLTLATNLQEYGSIEKMEEQLLSQNPRLKEYLKYKRLYEHPEVISQVNFSQKKSVENHVFMLGDAAGLIVPLCGNGMSMALHAAHGFSKLSNDFFDNHISRFEVERRYKKWWNSEFKLRLKIGRVLQQLFYQPKMVNPCLKMLSRLPRVADSIIAWTHGKDIK